MDIVWGTEGVGGRRALAACVVAASLSLASCASDQERQSASRGVPEAVGIDESTAERIGFGEALAQVRGHHIASLELYRARDFDAAAVHASHPIAELLDSLRGELEDADPAIADELESVLNDAAEAIEARAPAGELQRIYATAAEVTERAERSVVGEGADDSAYRGSVIAALLATVAHEYEEAIDGRRITLLAEYQDGYAFSQEARRLYEHLAAEVEQVSMEEAEEIEEAFDSLGQALPAVEPPSTPAPLDRVEKPAELIGHELAETVDAVVLTESDPAEVAEEIESLLAEIVDAYRAGEVDRAAELSAEAYLENYEVIEPEVIDKAPEVNEELEPLLGADLRRRMKEGAPVSEIEEMTERARVLLTEALNALGAHP